MVLGGQGVGTQSDLNWLHGVNMYAEKLPVIAATPAWYDVDSRLTSLYLNGSDVSRDFASDVADESDVVNVLAYRDEVNGKNGIIDLMDSEMSYGPVIFGVETRDLVIEFDRLTFWEEGLQSMQSALVKTWRKRRENEDLSAFSVHHYGSMKKVGRFGPKPID
ncbi:MAG: hypothetical protein ACI8QS_002952 [Planctomycetota bacterium]|jgi:hypothetical protein